MDKLTTAKHLDRRGAGLFADDRARQPNHAAGPDRKMAGSSGSSSRCREIHWAVRWIPSSRSTFALKPMSSAALETLGMRSSISAESALRKLIVDLEPRTRQIVSARPKIVTTA